MAARRYAGWDAGGWRESSRGASTGWCGAVGALGRGEEALYRLVDGEAERAAEQELRRRCGSAVLVEEMENGLVGELLWVMAVLLMHWIGVRRWWGWLSMVARDGGGGPVRE
jgi:hypothetical protein